MINMLSYLFLLAFMIFSSASLSLINADSRSDANDSVHIIEVIESESITLPCNLTNTFGYDIKWSYNDNILITDQSNRIHQIGNDLSISSAKRHDTGNYNCIATKIDGSNRHRRISSTAKLDIIWLDAAKVVYHPSDQIIKIHESSPFVLRCRINGNHLHEIRWIKDNQFVEASKLIEIDSHRLRIHYPNRIDSGIYKCIARNRIGSIQSKPFKIEFSCSEYYHASHHHALVCAHLNRKSVNDSTALLCRCKHNDRRSQAKRSANDEPDALQKPARKRQNVDETRGTVLNCDMRHIERGGQLIVRWKKDGKLIRQANLNGMHSDSININPMENPLLRDDGRLSVHTKNGSLLIASTIPSDSGFYECSLSQNGNGISSVITVELTIIEKLKFSPAPTTSKGLEMGSVGKIHCKVQGTPTPQIQWIREPSNTLPDGVEDINGTLVFKNVAETDRGNYTCIASNSQGQISSTVMVMPVIAPKFVVRPQGPIQVNEMGSVMIHCAAIGDPKPKIQWDKDLDYINVSNSDSSRLNILDNGTLYFTEVHLEDEGLYGCTIGSSAGLKREEAHLTVRPASDDMNADELQDGSFFIVRAVLITITVVISYIILVVGLMFWCRVKRKARKNRMQLIAKDNVETFAGNDTRPNDENEPCLPDTNNHKKNGNGWNGMTNEAIANNHKEGAQVSDDANPTNIPTKKSNLDQITIPRTIFFDLTQIGRGDFGTIHTAKVKLCDLKQHLHKDVAATITVANECDKNNSRVSIENVNEIKEDSPVDDTSVRYALLKALNKVKDESVCIEFRRQLDMFRAVSHRNVAKLYGLCRDKDPHYLVLEHSDLGDLKEFLLARVDQLDEITNKNGIIQTNNVDKTTKTALATPKIALTQLLTFAQHIVRGMDAIYRSRYIHRDLAARNCIISSDLTVKVSYPAIVKEKYMNEYYKLKNAMVPLRWMAPECIEDDDNTIKSDVYSFGVLATEIFDFCSKLPANTYTDDDYFKNLHKNQIERKLPKNLPEEISTLLMSCWQTNPKERPSFSTINTAISKHLEKLKATG